MSSMVSSHKRTKKVSSDSSALSFDLLTNLTYMAALSLGETSRDVVFERVMVQPFKTAVYFKQVYLLAKRLGFEYSSSFQVVSQSAGAPIVKNFLLRYSGAISSGESEGEFLAQEASVEREQYASMYERAIETLQKWGDAYAALLVLSQLGFGNCLRKRLRLLPFFRSVDVGGWQPWDENGMWSGWKGKNETSWND